MKVSNSPTDDYDYSILKQLLLSEQTENVLLAFKLIKQIDWNDELITPLFLVAILHPDKKIQLLAHQLLTNNNATNTSDLIQKLPFQSNYSTAAEIPERELLTRLLKIETLDPTLLVAYFYRRNPQYRLLDLILPNANQSLFLKIAQDHFLCDNGTIYSDYHNSKVVEVHNQNKKLFLQHPCLPQLINVQTLILNASQDTDFPFELTQLPNIQTIIIKFAHYQQLPPEIANWKKLQTCQIESSHIRALPDSIHHLQSLKQITITATALRKLPESISALTQLQLLELISCKLENLPDCLFQLPNLKILKIAGNPFTELNFKRLNYLPNLEQLVIDKHQAQKISYLNPNVKIEIMRPNKENFRY